MLIIKLLVILLGVLLMGLITLVLVVLDSLLNKGPQDIRRISDDR